MVGFVLFRVLFVWVFFFAPAHAQCILTMFVCLSGLLVLAVKVVSRSGESSTMVLVLQCIIFCLF